jgi:DMSO/TMAO reductase YedYZ molybdopterin-dependent catalytic subunit
VEPSAPLGRPIGRRAFLALVGAGMASVLWGDPAARLIGRVASPVTGVVSLGGGWRIYSVNPPMPRFDPATWHLRIDGLVAAPQRLTYDELRALPSVRQTSDFHCVTGWSVSGVRWAGVRLSALLAEARPLPAARALVFVSAEEPYADTLTLAQAMTPDALLAYDMDGAPLTRPHGAPARLVMPQMYGYKGVKWVTRIHVTDRVIDGFWEQRGYDRDAWIGRSNGF